MISLSDYSSYDGLGLAGLVARKEVTPKELLEAALAAAAAGARIIEKHFTLDKHYSDYRDHQLSVTPDELRLLVAEIKKVEVLLGQPEKTLQSCEAPLMNQIRRSIAAARPLAAGHRLMSKDLICMRPAGHWRPGEEKKLIGRRLKHSVVQGHHFLADDIAGRKGP